jgi:biopolymer transport protein ExbB
MEIARTTKTNWMKLMTVAVAGLLLSAAAHAGDWWDGAWTMRKKVTVDTTAAGGNVAEPIGASTVLVRLFGDGYPLAKEDLSDLRFVAEDGKKGYVKRESIQLEVKKQ